MGSKALALLWIGYAVVGQQDDEGIVPLRGLAEALYKASYAVVGIGKGVEVGILELAERHLKRLMAAERKERREPWLLAALTLLEHGEEPVEGQVVWHTPLAVVALVHRKVVLRRQFLESSGEKIASHIGEVDVAAI